MQMLKSQLAAAILIGVTGVCWAQAEKPKAPEHPMKMKFSTVQASPEWEKIKALAGDWERTSGSIKEKTSYKVTAANSAVVMTLPGDKPGDEMVTMFHPDGNSLLATHYCSAKNQPRMKLVPSNNPNEIRFKFVDGTNLGEKGVGYMTELALLLDGPDHHTQEWTFDMNGKPMTEKFEFKRKK
jgi:hypothetical protein